MEAKSYGENKKKRLITGRKDKDKEGRQVLKLRVDTIPTDCGNRTFETYTSESGTYCYEIFSNFTAVVKSVYKMSKKIKEIDMPFLALDVESGGEEIIWEVGQLDSRNSLNLLARMLNPYYEPWEKATFTPYDMTRDGKRQIGISIRQGVDTIGSPEWNVLKDQGRPDPRTWEGRGGKIEYDFMPVAEWMLDRVIKKITGIGPAPTQTSVRASSDANQITSNVHVEYSPANDRAGKSYDEDDLPF